MSRRFRQFPGQMLLGLVCRSRCGEAVIGRKHKYCRSCFAAYMRGWRPSHPLTDEQREKDTVRSLANVYKQRGKLVPQVCACGSADVEMHHPDYSKPLLVEWTCRACHLKLHKECHT